MNPDASPQAFHFPSLYTHRAKTSLVGVCTDKHLLGFLSVNHVSIPTCVSTCHFNTQELTWGRELR